MMKHIRKTALATLGAGATAALLLAAPPSYAGEGGLGFNYCERENFPDGAPPSMIYSTAFSAPWETTTVELQEAFKAYLNPRYGAFNDYMVINCWGPYDSMEDAQQHMEQSAKLDQGGADHRKVQIVRWAYGDE